MLRKLGGFLSLLAALLCIGVIALWCRSRRHADVLLVRTTNHHAAGAALGRGGLLLAQSDLPFEGSVSATGEERAVALFPVSVDEFMPINDALFDTQSTVKFSLLGFKTAAGQASITSALTPRFSAVIIPYWLLVTITAPLALRGLRAAWIGRRRIRKGLCLGCGYDIRASTGRCPECGKEIAKAAAPKTPWGA